MRFSCFTAAAPVGNLEQQCAVIAQSGCAGVETICFPQQSLERWQAGLQTVTNNAGIEVAAVIVGGLALHRENQDGYVQEALHAVASLPSAIAVITPQYEAQAPMPLLPPHPAADPLATQRVRDAFEMIDQTSARLNLRVCIEPVTQFESQFCRTVAGTQVLIEGCRYLRLCLDFHNMNITETDIAASIASAQGLIGHIHVADNNRLLPGKGHIGFAPGLQALRRINYTGWYSFECAVPGDFEYEVMQATRYLEDRSK